MNVLSHMWGQVYMAVLRPWVTGYVSVFLCELVCPGMECRCGRCVCLKEVVCRTVCLQVFLCRAGVSCLVVCLGLREL